MRSTQARDGPWLAKLDVQHAFCSPKLPREWRGVFRLEMADGRKYKYNKMKTCALDMPNYSKTARE